GGTLRAVKAYVDWIEEGEPYLLGASYLAPLDRHFLQQVLPDREALPYEDDVRIPARDIAAREGSVGTSAVGEAYYNFGAIGPFRMLFVLGIVCAWLESRARQTPYGCASLGVAMSVFFLNIRGQWLPVPAQLAFGSTIVAACWLLDGVMNG